MIFVLILMILFHQSSCQRVSQQNLLGDLKSMCPMKSEAAFQEYNQTMNTTTESLGKKVSNILDILASLRLAVGYSMCRSGYEYYQQDKFCYKFHRECKTWSEARRVCQQEGGDLISLKEGNINYFKSVAKREAGPCNDTWIGATDINPEGLWTWLNGERLTHIFWYPEEPANLEGMEHCGDMMKNYDYLMNDANCNSKLHFLCQIV